MIRAAALLALVAAAGCGPRTEAPVAAPGGQGGGVDTPPPAALRGSVRVGTVMALKLGQSGVAVPVDVVKQPIVLDFGDGAGLHGRVAQTPQVTPQNPIVVGRLDPLAIKSVIRQNLSSISACYQQTLVVQPHTAGTVNIKFVIGPSGAVVSAGVTGLPAVASCLEAVLRRLKFQPPPGGGTVTVSYPFLFRAMGTGTGGGFGTGTGGFGPSGPPPPPPKPMPPPARHERLPGEEPPPPVAPARIRCEATDLPDAVRAALPGLTDCYQTALQTDPGLSGLVLVTVRRGPEGAASEVTMQGAEHEGFQRCALQQLAGVRAPADHDLAFSLALVTDSLPADATEITIGAESLHVGMMLRRRFMRDWHRPAGRSGEFVDKIAKELGTARPILLRGDDDAPGIGVARTRERLAQAGIAVVVTRKRDDTWTQILAPERKDPWPAVCPAGFEPDAERPMAVSVMLSTDGVWIGTGDEPATFIRHRRNALDTLAYARHLRDLKRGDLRSRADAEIAAERDVSWHDLALATDILHDTGFYELRLVPTPEYDPRRD